MPGTPYSREEKRILRRGYSEGTAAKWIGIEIGRTERSVYHQAAKMKLKHSKLYTRKQEKLIRVMHAEGKTPEEIADALKRPLPGLERKMYALGLVSGVRFSRKEMATIRRLKRLKYNAVQIAAALPGRDVDSVRGKLNRMGLSSKSRKAKKALEARAARRMNSEQHRKFCDFLRACTLRLEPIPVLEIVLLWNKHAGEQGVPEVTRDKTEYWLEKLKLPAISGKDVKQKSCQAFKRRQRLKLQTLHDGLSVKDDEELKRLHRLRDEVFATSDTVAEAFCPRCPEDEGAWPVTEDFFYFHQNGDGQAVPSLGMCIPCSKRHRRAVNAMERAGATKQEIKSWCKGMSKIARARTRAFRLGQHGRIHPAHSSKFKRVVG